MAKRVLSTTGKKGSRTAASTGKGNGARKNARVIKNSSNKTPAKKRRAAAPPPVIAPVLASASSKLTKEADAAEAAKAKAAAESRGEPVPISYIDRGLPLPDSYGLDRLVALVRDPQWIYCYWELSGSRLNELRAQRGQAFIDACAWVLRLYRINENVAEDMEIEPAIGNWYIQVGRHGKYQVELALLSPDGEWITLCVSQIVETPREGPSDIIDDEWRMRPEDEEVLLGAARELMEARKRGVSGVLGASRLQSSFALASSGMLGASASGRPVAGSWAFSFIGASRVSGSAGSGGFGWMQSPTGAQEPVLERPSGQRGGPNWNTQNNLPGGKPGKTQQPNFQVKLPRLIQGIKPPAPTWPPAKEARVSATRRSGAVKTAKGTAK